ncbi:hypothetical protein [Acidovorax sp. LjRoot117]|uniref:hypothetical protein n=1 Tax=Acidovorax sp. LjRoot117 TaxID=3342255 RepID=UPI003ECCA4DE
MEPPSETWNRYREISAHKPRQRNPRKPDLRRFVGDPANQLFRACCIRPAAKQTEKNRNRDETTQHAVMGTMEPMFNAPLLSSTPGGKSRPQLPLTASQDALHTRQPLAPVIVSNTGTVSLRPDGFSLNSPGVQFIPSMSRTRKATHRTRDLAMDTFRSCTGYRLF